ncbi:hypothetical protein SNK04_002456 [Fusarium graminearum]
MHIRGRTCTALWYIPAKVERAVSLASQPSFQLHLFLRDSLIFYHQHSDTLKLASIRAFLLGLDSGVNQTSKEIRWVFLIPSQGGEVRRFNVASRNGVDDIAWSIVVISVFRS